MERTLVLIRHAKSDWSTPGQTDYERSLNERGKRDAPVMGQRLRQKNIIPDLILSSPAKRAASTAKLVAPEVGYEEGKIQWIEKLYHCPSFMFEDVLIGAAIADDVKTVFVFAHNPGITDFANDTTPHLNIANIPTCGMVAMTFTAEHWNDFPLAKHSLLFFDYPKNQ